MATGTNANELLSGSGSVSAGAGNDILVVNAGGSASLDGGLGRDSFVIKGYGSSATIGGPLGERVDRLVFNALGVISAEADEESDALTFSIREGGTGLTSSVTIADWYAAGSYRVADVMKVRPMDTSYWSVESYQPGKLGLQGW